MPGKCCKKRGGRKHTPIVSKKQQGLFGAEYSRRKKGKSSRMKGITTEELRLHLKESKDKKLPLTSNKKRTQRRSRKRRR